MTWPRLPTPSVLEHLESGQEPALSRIAGLVHEHDYSYCIVSEQKCLKRTVLYFSLNCCSVNCQNQWPTVAQHWGFFNPYPSDCRDLFWPNLIFQTAETYYDWLWHKNFTSTLTILCFKITIQKTGSWSEGTACTSCISLQILPFQNSL